MKYNTKAIALIAFLTILSSYVVQVNCNEYDDLFLIEDEDLLSEDNQYLEDENFFDLSQKLNQIRREKNFLEQSEDLYYSETQDLEEEQEEEEEFVDLYESNPDEMDELEWKWWWDHKKKEAKQKKSADTTTQGDQTLSQEFIADVVEEALEETAEKLEYEQGNLLQDTPICCESGVYTFYDAKNFGIHIDSKGVKMRKINDMKNIPAGFKLNIQQCGDKKFFTISRSWNEGGVSRVVYVNPSNILSMDGTPHCNFKIYRDATKGVPVLKVSDGRYVWCNNYRDNFYGKNDGACDLALDQSAIIAEALIIKKW